MHFIAARHERSLLRAMSAAAAAAGVQPYATSVRAAQAHE
jgi:hypothetical protein